MTPQELRRRATTLPRFFLTHLPTPLDYCARFTAALETSAKIYLKRDDLTTIGLGGNKLRKLEFILGRALADGCDCIVHGLAGQSNYCRQTAAACARAGLPCHLVLAQNHKAADPPQANRLLDYVFGARVQMVPPSDQAATIDRLVESLQQGGHKPYRIGPDDEVLGAVSYALALAEILEQSAAIGFMPDVIAVTGRGGTLAGLVLGKHLLDFPGQIQAFDVDPKSNLERWARAGSDTARQAAELLGVSIDIPTDSFHNTVAYAGAGYGIESDEGLEALLLLGRTEGLVVGPVYAGKGLSGLIDYVRKERFAPGANIVFIHTGGITEAFAYNQEIWERVQNKQLPPGA